MKNLLNKKEFIVIAVLALIKLVVHLLTSTTYDLHRDTFLYFSLGEHPDWGYVSIPPFTGAIAWLSDKLFGASAFGINIFPAVIGAICVIIISLIVKEFGGGSFAIFLANLVYILSPSYLRVNSLFQPVAFDVFFWLLSGLFIVKLLKTLDPKYWIIILVVWAFGFLNKYLMAVYAISFLVGLLFTRNKNLLLSKYFLIGSIIGLIIVMPNIIWQINHHLPVVHHLEELNRYQLVNVSMVGYLIDQLAMNIPGLVVWLTGLIFLFISKDEKKYPALALASVFTILLLMLLHGKSYYTLGLYPLLFAAGGYIIEKRWNKYLKIIVIFLSIVIALPAIPFSLPVLSFEKLESYTKPFAEVTNRWEDGKIHILPQDYADMTGWNELGMLVVKTYNSLPVNERIDCAIYAENYGQAGAIKFCGERFGLPEPISFCDNFIIWAPDSVTKTNLIYVNDQIGDIDKLFRKYTLIGVINNKYFRENGVKVFYCTQPVDTFKNFYAKKARFIKMQFGLVK